MKLPYAVLDVFTQTRLKGNPLAIVSKADTLTTAQMQAIAAEFNLSETVFVLNATHDRSAAKLRIFTPYKELEFAGHPVLGAAIYIGLTRKLSAVRLELPNGQVLSVIDKIDGRTATGKFALPSLPVRVGDAASHAEIAQCLGLNIEQIGCNGVQPAIYSAGNAFCIVPVENAEAVNAVQIDITHWARVFGSSNNGVYVYALRDGHILSRIEARMFRPITGGGEDAATGSAAAALIGLLAAQEKNGDGAHSFTISQGVKMGRPSELEITFQLENGKITHAGLGGSAVMWADGMIDFYDME